VLEMLSVGSKLWKSDWLSCRVWQTCWGSWRHAEAGIWLRRSWKCHPRTTRG